jgi:H+/Cl- antiporter ClcA
VQDSSEQWWWLAFAVALLAIAFGPWVVARFEPKDTDTGTGTDGTLPETTLEVQ